MAFAGAHPVAILVVLAALAATAGIFLFLQVMIAGRTAQVSWGPRFDGEYDERFGNLDVRYGGHDEHVLVRIKAAVSSLR